MLNPNSCAIITGKTSRVSKLIRVYTEFCKISLKTFCLEPWNCMHPLLGTLTWNFGMLWNLLEPLLGTLAWNTWNLGTSWNLYLEHWNLPESLLGTWILDLEPLLGTLEPPNLAEPCGMTAPECPWAYFGWDPKAFSCWEKSCLEPRNLPRTLTLRTLLGNSEPAGTFTWNPIVWNLGTFRNLYSEPFLEPRNLPEPLLGTLLGTSEPAQTFTWNPIVWNLGTCRNLCSESFLEPRNLPEPLLGTLLGTSEPAGTFTRNPSWNLGALEPAGTFTWNLLLGTLENLPEPWHILEPWLGTSEPAGTFTWKSCLEPRNLCQNLNSQNPSWKLRTCRNLYLEPNCLEPRNLPEPLLGTLLGTSEPAGTFARNPSWNLGTCRNLYLEPDCLEPRNLPEPLLGTLLGTSEPAGTFLLGTLLGTSEPAQTFTWNPCLEPRNLPEPLLGTLLGTSEPSGTFTRNPSWNLGTCRDLYSEPFLEPRSLGTCWNFTWNLLLGTLENLPGPLLGTWLGTSEPAGTFTWKSCLEPRNLCQNLDSQNPSWKLRTCRNLYLEPNCLEPRNLPEPLLGTLLGTSEPAGTRRDDCPRVPQGLVWLGPQSFQLLGNNNHVVKQLQIKHFPIGYYFQPVSANKAQQATRLLILEPESIRRLKWDLLKLNIAKIPPAVRRAKEHRTEDEHAPNLGQAQKVHVYTATNARLVQWRVRKTWLSSFKRHIFLASSWTCHCPLNSGAQEWRNGLLRTIVGKLTCRTSLASTNLPILTWDFWRIFLLAVIRLGSTPTWSSVSFCGFLMFIGAVVFVASSLFPSDAKSLRDVLLLFVDSGRGRLWSPEICGNPFPVAFKPLIIQETMRRFHKEGVTFGWTSLGGTFVLFQIVRDLSRILDLPVEQCLKNLVWIPAVIISQLDVRDLRLSPFIHLNCKKVIQPRSGTMLDVCAEKLMEHQKHLSTTALSVVQRLLLTDCNVGKCRKQLGIQSHVLLSIGQIFHFSSFFPNLIHPFESLVRKSRCCHDGIPNFDLPVSVVLRLWERRRLGVTDLVASFSLLFLVRSFFKTAKSLPSSPSSSFVRIIILVIVIIIIIVRRATTTSRSLLSLSGLLRALLSPFLFIRRIVAIRRRTSSISRRNASNWRYKPRRDRRNKKTVLIASVLGVWSRTPKGTCWMARDQFKCLTNQYWKEKMPEWLNSLVVESQFSFLHASHHQVWVRMAKKQWDLKNTKWKNVCTRLCDHEICGCSIFFMSCSLVHSWILRKGFDS